MKREWRERAMLIISGLLIGLLLLEVALRLIGFDYPTFYMADDRHGYRLLPGAEGWWQQEGEAFVRINLDGWRDRDHPKQKPSNTIRIAILGDSFAEAFQVSLEEAFWQVMAEALTERDCFSGQDIEVLNFGVGGYSTAQQLLVLQNEVWAYDPDLVLLAMFAGNDIKENDYLLNQRSEYAYFTYDNGQLALDPAYPKNKLLRLRQLFGYGSNYLHVLGLLHMLRDTLQAWAQQPPPRDAVWTEFGLDNAIFKPPASIAWQTAWQMTEDLLIKMRDEIAAHHAEFLIVTLSTGISAHPDPTVRAQFIEQMGIDDLFYPDRRITTLADRAGIANLTLAQRFQAYAEQHQVFLHGFENAYLGGGHWNQAGHRLAGELIAERLCEGK